MALVDTFGRELSYARISLTDRCNYRCLYCMPETGVQWLSHEEILRLEEVSLLCHVLFDIGVQKVRFTGGEPLVRKGVVPFLARLHEELPGLRMAFTTNGALLTRFASELLEVGLSGINVSLDTLNPEKFRRVTRCGVLDDVLAGIRAVRERNMPVKLNTVLMRGFNEEEVPALIDFARNQGLTLRFIEFMPLDGGVWDEASFLSSDDIFRMLPQAECWERQEQHDHSVGPAVYYKNRETGQRIGIIAAVSHHFCESCNRLRFSASGELRPCLFSTETIDLRDALRRGDVQEVRRRILEGASRKPESWHACVRGEIRPMSRIGG